MMSFSFHDPHLLTLLPWTLLDWPRMSYSQNIFLSQYHRFQLTCPFFFLILSLSPFADGALKSFSLFLGLFAKILSPLNCEVLLLWENVSITMGHKHRKGVRPGYLAEKNDQRLKFQAGLNAPSWLSCFLLHTMLISLQRQNLVTDKMWTMMDSVILALRKWQLKPATEAGS